MKNEQDDGSGGPAHLDEEQARAWGAAAATGTSRNAYHWRSDEVLN